MKLAELQDTIKKVGITPYALVLCFYPLDILMIKFDSNTNINIFEKFLATNFIIVVKK
jgi:hypothetical protein